MDPPIEKALKCIRDDNDKLLDKLISNDGRLITYRDKQGMSLLHRAALNGTYNCIQVLLRRGLGYGFISFLDHYKIIFLKVVCIV